MKLFIAIASMLAKGHLVRAHEDAAGVTPVAKKDAALPSLRALKASGARGLQATLGDLVKVVDESNGVYSNRCWDFNFLINNIGTLTCNPTNNNQLFGYIEATQAINLPNIVSGDGSGCLLYDTGTSQTQNVYMSSCPGIYNWSARWVYDRISKKVKTLEDNLCLEMSLQPSSGGVTQDFNLYMNTCLPVDNQKFDLPPDWNIVSPEDRIIHVDTGLAMEANPDSTTNAVADDPRDPSTNPFYYRQVLRYVPATRTIKYARTEWCLNYGPSGVVGIPIPDPDNNVHFTNLCNDQAASQQWFYDSATQQLVSQEGKCLEIETGNSNNLIMAPCVAGQADQQFNIPSTWAMEPPPTATTTAATTAAATTAAATTAAATTTSNNEPNWDIIYDSVTSDFSSDSTDELVLTYDIGKGRAYTAELFAGDCATPIDGGALGSSSPPTTAPKDSNYDTLTVRHDINKANIPNSNIWSSANTQVEVCQVVKLYVENGADDLIIAEDKHVITIDMTLSSNYSIENAPLAAAPPAGADSDAATVSGYLNAYQCDGVAFNSITAPPLSPTEELVVCIKSTSTDVTIDNLESMNIVQTAPNPSPSFAVIAADAIEFASITSREYVPSKNGVVVRTLLPTNKFAYVDDATVDISGTVNLQFAGGRRLRADAGTSLDSDDTAAFELQVDLKEMPIDEDHASSAVATKGALGAAFALVSATMLW